MARIWEVLNKSKVSKQKEIIDILLKNRGLRTKKQKKDFMNPLSPEKIVLQDLKISFPQVTKAIKRIKKALKEKEAVIVYGDYDADGICATAILWEVLYSLGINAMPHIPDRFKEGYGLNVNSIQSLKTKNPNLKLIITVDNGIVASEGVKAAKKLGIDVIITDHHTKGKKILKPFALVHTTEIGGAGLAWIFSREILKKLKIKDWKLKIDKSLELAAIGTIADQLPLIGANRSLVKYGLGRLRKTKRPGLLELFREAGVDRDSISTYTINFMIAPRINAMGRLEHAIDSLRLLCTKNSQRAKELASFLGKTNVKRQAMVEKAVFLARGLVKKKDWQGVIVLVHESFHEGVIGLVASRIVEEVYRPVIVLARGEKRAKASARSISGFNIIKAIMKLESLIIDGGGHPMAAGFSIDEKKIKRFEKEMEKVSKPLLTQDVLTRKLKIDLEVDFNQLNEDLTKSIEDFQPNGIGNPTPLFATRGINVLNSRTVGKGREHLKLTLEKDGKIFDAIAFRFGKFSSKLSKDASVDVAYFLEENIWNGVKSLQLRVKDLSMNAFV